MELREKVADAVMLIEAALVVHAQPVVMSSFGKDSMVLLDLVKRAGVQLPIVFFREPFFPKKYEFAEAVIREEEYVVYDYPPRITYVSCGESAIEIVNMHDSVLGAAPIYLPTGIVKPTEGQHYLCGLKDIYEKPLGTFAFPWDLVMVGHKSSDKDPILNSVVLNTSYHEGKPSVLLPLKDFTDEDVWDYTVQQGLPINKKRYNEHNNWREFSDTTHNPDYFEACTACIDLRSPATVWCPKIQAEIPNISKSVRQLRSLDLPQYVGG